MRYISSQYISPSLLFFLCFFASSLTYAGTCCGTKTCPDPCPPGPCCSNMGGVSYCDSSAGRAVCNNGFYSSCYCTRHAIMDLQKLAGCCLWQGGVLTIDDLTGVVVCNNGGVSESCTLAQPNQQIKVW